MDLPSRPRPTLLCDFRVEASVLSRSAFKCEVLPSFGFCQDFRIPQVVREILHDLEIFLPIKFVNYKLRFRCHLCISAECD